MPAPVPTSAPSAPPTVEARGHARRRSAVVGGSVGLAAVLGAAAAAGLLPASPLALVLPIVPLAYAAVVLAAAAPPEGLLGRVVAPAAEWVEERGGGWYGLGALATYAALEVQSLRADVAAAAGWRELLRGEAWQWIAGFGVDSILNAVWAGIWPWHWMTEHGYVAAGVLAAAAWALHAAGGRLLGDETGDDGAA